MNRKSNPNRANSLFRQLVLAGAASMAFGICSANGETARASNSNDVGDFMVGLPRSDDMKKNPSYGNEMVHPFEASPATYRIYDHKNGKQKRALLQRARSDFTKECDAKGGDILPESSQDYHSTIEHLKYSVPDATVLICVTPNQQSLGMLITLKRNVRRSDPEAINDIGAAAMSTIFDNAPYYLIALMPSDAVYTQARLDREAAEQRHKQNLLEAENSRIYNQERKEAEAWRLTIKTGIETGCGPVLSVKGDLIEVAHYQTRESKWYRRSELWPSRFTKSGLRTCN